MRSRLRAAQLRVPLAVRAKLQSHRRRWVLATVEWACIGDEDGRLGAHAHYNLKHTRPGTPHALVAAVSPSRPIRAPRPDATAPRAQSGQG